MPNSLVRLPIISLVFNDNCPSVYGDEELEDIADSLEDYDSNGNEIMLGKISDGIKSGKLTDRLKDIIYKTFIEDCADRATIRMKMITEGAVGRFTREQIYKDMGWNQPNAINAYGNKGVMDIWEDFGYSIYQWGVYYVFISGVSTYIERPIY